MSDVEEEFEHPPGNSPTATPNPPPGVELIRFRDFASIIRLLDSDRLTNDNWYDWKESIANIFVTCNVVSYVEGDLRCPKKQNDPMGHQNWIQNDSWVRSIITVNLTPNL